MGKYVLTYHGGSHEMPTTEAEKEQLMAAWGVRNFSAEQATSTAP